MTRRVHALRGFWIDGKLIKPGSTVEIDDMLVNELVHSQKVMIVESPVKPVAPAKEKEKTHGPATKTAKD